VKEEAPQEEAPQEEAHQEEAHQEEVHQEEAQAQGQSPPLLPKAQFLQLHPET